MKENWKTEKMSVSLVYSSVLDHESICDVNFDIYILVICILYIYIYTHTHTHEFWCMNSYIDSSDMNFIY
jgi:hypothetical protein